MLKHQVISIYNPNYVFIVLDKFHIKYSIYSVLPNHPSTHPWRVKSFFGRVKILLS